jgi:DeoR/GlpR family transcriptional regulator of sugar metabolism
MKATKRQSAISEILSLGDEVAIGELARQFDVSEMTIRRDLDHLAEIGLVRRTHGGAIPAERMVFEFDFASRRQANRAAKRAIAAEAARLIKPGLRLILDTGTTTLELAHLLRDFEDLTVITPSLAVASELQFAQGVQTVLLGGVIRRGRADLAGLVTEAALEMFAADIAFQGADGIGPDGALYTADMSIAKVDQKIRTRAQRTYILADSSKIGTTALTRHGFVQQVDALITDSGIKNEDRRRLEKLGAEIIIVSTA